MVALLVMLIWLTTLAVFVNSNISLPAESCNTPPPDKPEILGAFILRLLNFYVVSVCVCALNVTSSSPVSKGNVIVLSADNSDTATTYWWSALVSFIYELLILDS